MVPMGIRRARGGRTGPRLPVRARQRTGARSWRTGWWSLDGRSRARRRAMARRWLTMALRRSVAPSGRDTVRLGRARGAWALRRGTVAPHRPAVARLR
ncbi:hypothetical protein UO65_3858 [Actinokineospora spheciospongiae]|uniref:Uncharacterized protein n=1 Tax=Actinokineospora spheciospongiae TaxID=909613 RepID=W7IKQ4_9PSEU|nr:hypothetical protein UO65_3858 [Actinokineospora spheciospongiae]